MKKSFLHVALAALLLAGCSQNEIMEVSPDAAPPVGFKVFTDAQTRGTVTTGVTGTGFGVFAYYTAQSAWSNTGSFTPNFMYNQIVNYSSGWTYNPVKYWPNTEGDKISFFAYAPHSTKSGSGIKFTTTTTTATGAPKLNFELQATPQSMVDLLATDATQTGNDKTIDVTKSTATVAFKLKHVLTRASFKAKLDASLTGYSAATHVFITGMRILGTQARTDAANTGNSVTANASSKFYSAATYQWSDGMWAASPAPTPQTTAYNLGNTSFMALTSPSGISGYTTSSIELPQAATEVPLLKSGQYAFLIPPYNKDGIKTSTDVRMQIDYDIVTVDGELSKGYSITSTTATVSLPNGTLQLGKAYIFTFTVGLEDVKVSATVDAWAADQSFYAPRTTATSAATLLTAIGEMNTAKGNNKNCNYFVIDCTGSYGSTLNLSSMTVTNFASGDKIELNFAASPGITSISLPSTWQADKTALSAAGKIILTRK